MSVPERRCVVALRHPDPSRCRTKIRNHTTGYRSAWPPGSRSGSRPIERWTGTTAAISVAPGRLFDDVVELAAARLDQRRHPAEPLFHPGALHCLTEPLLPGGEALHLGLGDGGEEGAGGISQDTELRRQLAGIAHPRVELPEEGH